MKWERGKEGCLRDGALGAGGAEVLRVALADEEAVLLVRGDAVAGVGHVGYRASSIAIYSLVHVSMDADI